MHIVTFYSFKGGVGRTMALVNAAAELALRGRRVLVVDFDLEAPGIQTYQPFTKGIHSPGIVDYVTEFIESGEAKHVANFVIEQKINDTSIWLMPAGRSDADYGRRLNSIDWQMLYKDLDGYLMFEDLKQQWKSVLNADYVLIDSRTGHTDVGGICTRQLPDASVLMFFPNDQNLTGLEAVAHTIRREADKSRKKAIHLHFCPSNIPDIDDEELILRRHLEDAMKRLSYKSPAAIIHHYNSLALLDQKIFVLDRPTTRLAQEYRKLVDTIVAENLEDKSGALYRLDQIRSSPQTLRNIPNLPELEGILETIYTIHKNDGEVAWALSHVYDKLGDIDGQIDTLGIAIERHYNEADARRRRALLLRGESRIELAREDLQAVILAPDVSVSDLVNSLERLREIDPEWVATAKKSTVIGNLRGRALERVANTLVTSRQGAQLAMKLLLEERQPENRDISSLAAIGARDYRTAIDILGDRDHVLRAPNIQDAFNLAAAEWGQNGSPPLDLFQHVAELFEGKRNEEEHLGPNMQQCLSLTYHVLGDDAKAYKYLRLARKSVNSMPPIHILSCWRFLNVKRSEMIEDLKQMHLQMANHETPFAPNYVRDTT